MSLARRVLTLEDARAASALFGEHNESLKLVESLAAVKIHARGTELRIEGETHDVDLAARLLEDVYELAVAGRAVEASDLQSAFDVLSADRRVRLRDVLDDTIWMAPGRRRIRPRSLNQKRYVDSIRRHDLVFAVGPAGTGKTYLAMAMAVDALKRQTVRRIILTRPAVEAGEKLGFLPGDLVEKVNPYLRPLYDALNDMMDPEAVGRLLERGTVEVAPLAFMRGRTLADAFVILDEAQNTTAEQMKMFLTRLGVGSRAVVTGDVTQIDLPSDRRSGLLDALDVLAGVEAIGFSQFSPDDVVRHPLVQSIVDAYQKADARQADSGKADSGKAGGGKADGGTGDGGTGDGGEAGGGGPVGGEVPRPSPVEADPS